MCFGIQKKVDVMLAYANGAQVEKKEIWSEEPFELDVVPLWNWEKYVYRIKKSY